jgi:hypothetical protein
MSSAPPTGASAPASAPEQEPADPFATAKSNLRDTVKWLATTFAALAAVVLAGSSLTGISQLSGSALTLALAGGGLGVICVIVATGLMLQLLISNTFFISQVDKPEYATLKAYLNLHSIDIVPPEIKSVDKFLELRHEAIDQVRRYANAPDSNGYREASRFIADAEVAMARLTSLAQLELLRTNLRAAVPKLFLLALGALVGLGVFAVFAGAAKSGKDTSSACCQSNTAGQAPANAGKKPAQASESATLRLDTGVNWTNIGNQLAKACGETINIEIIPAAQTGWVNARILSPKQCSGVVLPLPADLIIPTVSK